MLVATFGSLGLLSVVGDKSLMRFVTDLLAHDRGFCALLMLSVDLPSDSKKPGMGELAYWGFYQFLTKLLVPLLLGSLSFVRMLEDASYKLLRTFLLDLCLLLRTDRFLGRADWLFCELAPY